MKAINAKTNITTVVTVEWPMTIVVRDANKLTIACGTATAADSAVVVATTDVAVVLLKTKLWLL